MEYDPEKELKEIEELKKLSPEEFLKRMSPEFFEEDDDEEFWETEEEVAEGEGFYIDDDGNWIPKDDSPVF